MIRLRTILSRYALDLLAIGGLLFIAYGLGQAPEPWGAMFGPVAFGLGLVGAVRLGAR